MPEIKKYIQEFSLLIIKGELKVALEEAGKLLRGSPLLFEVIQQQGRYQELTEKVRKGIISQGDETVEENKIRWALLEILRVIELEGTDNERMKAELMPTIEKSGKIIYQTVFSGQGNTAQFGNNNTQIINVSKGKTRFEKEFRILVIANTSERMSQLEKNKESSPLFSYKNQYGNRPEDWRPFQQGRTIEELLKEYKKQSSFTVKFDFLDPMQMQPEELVDIRQKYNKSALAIIDPNLFLCEYFHKIVPYYNNTDIGGAIVPFCRTWQQTDEETMSRLHEKHFDRLYDKKYKAIYEPSTKVELNVADKKVLFRRITNMAFHNLCFKPPLKSRLFDDSIKGDSDLMGPNM